VRLGRRLRLRRQPPGSWQLWNGGVQRGVSFCGSRNRAFRSAPTQTGITWVLIRNGGARARVSRYPSVKTWCGLNWLFAFAGNRCGDCFFNGLKCWDALAQSSAAGYIHLSLKWTTLAASSLRRPHRPSAKNARRRKGAGATNCYVLIPSNSAIAEIRRETLEKHGKSETVASAVLLSSCFTSLCSDLVASSGTFVRSLRNPVTGSVRECS